MNKTLAKCGEEETELDLPAFADFCNVRTDRAQAEGLLIREGSSPNPPTC